MQGEHMTDGGRVTLTFPTRKGITAPMIDGIGEVTVIRGADGTPCGFTFPAPFDGLTLLQGQPVTPDLRGRVAEALDYFAQHG